MKVGDLVVPDWDVDRNLLGLIVEGPHSLMEPDKAEIDETSVVIVKWFGEWGDQGPESYSCNYLTVVSSAKS